MLKNHGMELYVVKKSLLILIPGGLCRAGMLSSSTEVVTFAWTGLKVSPNWPSCPIQFSKYGGGGVIC